MLIRHSLFFGDNITPNNPVHTGFLWYPLFSVKTLFSFCFYQPRLFKLWNVFLTNYLLSYPKRGSYRSIGSRKPISRFTLILTDKKALSLD